MRSLKFKNLTVLKTLITMSATYSTPTYMNSLAQMAKANRVSNKVVKAKKAAKAKRATEFQRDHDDATNMDTELTKLENIAATEEAKLAKEVAK
jgi:hypothetical protein